MARCLSLGLLTLVALCFACQVLGSVVPQDKVNVVSRSKKHHHHYKQSTSSKFCQKFTKECYNVALGGKTGHITVTHECERHGKKHSHSYSFGCKADRKDVTSQVLYNIGADNVVTSTYGSVKTSSVTVTATPAIKTTTVSSTLTTTVATSTVVVPVLQAVIAPPPRKRSSKSVLDKSVFCSAFSNGCESHCTKIKSTPKHVACHSTSLHHYSLTCQCANGIMETQHALYDAAGKQLVESVSTVTTSFKTVATVKPTHTVTKSVITTIKATATSTTQVVLAPTGLVQLFSAKEESDESSIGYIASGEGLYVSQDDGQAFMAVQDPKSGLYQLQIPGNSGWFAISVYPQGNGNADFTVKESYGVAEYLGADVDSCGAASTAPAPADGTLYCETFVFDFVADAQTLKDGSTNLTMQWYNPGTTSPKEYSWLVDQYGDFGAGADANSAPYNGPAGSAKQVFLRYPITVAGIP